MLSKDRAPDAEELLNLLKANHITLLNTWAARQVDARKFCFGKHSAQLDYVMIRQKDANLQARQAQPITQCPLGAWRHAGGHHFPLMASIRKKIPPPRKLTAPVLQADREKICARQPQKPDHAILVQHFRESTQQELDQVVSVPDLGNIADKVVQVAAIVFPVQKASVAKYSNPILLSLGITSMWRRWMLIKRARSGAGLQQIFRRWKVWAAYFRHFASIRNNARNVRNSSCVTKWLKLNLPPENTISGVSTI